MRISTLFLLLALSGPSHVYPQSKSTRLVSGMVVSGDGSGPLEGVAVGVKGTNIISGSQQDGMYYIEVPVNDSVLVFAHDDYQTTEIKLGGGNECHVVLKKAPPGIVDHRGMNIYIFIVHVPFYHYLSRLRCRYCRHHSPSLPVT